VTDAGGAGRNFIWFLRFSSLSPNPHPSVSIAAKSKIPIRHIRFRMTIEDLRQER
jgi:hypothetical protein